MRSERGMTLVEMLVAMTVFLVVLGGALGLLQSQSKTFRRGTDESGILQNLRFGVEEVDQQVRLAGSNAADDQPAIVYASANALAFNADYVANTASDISAAYIDVDVPTGQSTALTSAITIPGSAPSFSYPSTAFASFAETITFFFQVDAETARTDDYVLMRQVNNGAAEALVRNVLPYTGRPFFQYYYLSVTGGVQSNQLVPTGWLPLRHSVASHDIAADTGSAARIDSLRAVELSYSVTNGRTGTEERVRQISTIIPLPNLTSKKMQSCGHEPLFGQTVTVKPNPVFGIDLSWKAATDETAGEQDVLRYVVWRRLTTTTSWGDPIATVPSGSSPYGYTDGNVKSGSSYDYAVAAQDCTPSLSPLIIVLNVKAP